MQEPSQHLPAPKPQQPLVASLLAAAATVLLLTGAAKIMTVMGGGEVLAQLDPLLQVRNQWLIPVLGIAEILVGAFLLGSRRPLLAGGITIVLGTEFLLYKVFVGLASPGAPCPCLGSIGELFGFSQIEVNNLTTILSVGLVALGVAVVVLDCKGSKHQVLLQSG
ncbi:MAG: MauE/DoxX family redox-associated membrane protein [Verrucomicrobiota bacterium]